MIEKIIAFSIKNKLIISIFVLFLIISGVYSMFKIPLDAVPDITNNQVQIVTTSPSLAPEEVEKLITYPLEISLSNIPNVLEIRSISKYGLSVITVVFEEDIPIMLARQFVNEQIGIVKSQMPSNIGIPELMPITTGLGEVYQYTLKVDNEYKDKYSLLELRNIQDWLVKRELSGTKGVIDVSSFGGFVKEYEITISPEKLFAYNLSIQEVYEAIQKNNTNSGAGYIEKESNVYYIRLDGLSKNIEELELITIKLIDGKPVIIKDIAEVGLGSPKRYGAMTKDGNGEAVGGIALMLKEANSYQTINNIKNKVELVNQILPEGIEITPYLERTYLIDSTIATVSKNLIEGGLIVIFVLVLLLGNYRGGIIVASVIPLSMLFALVMMNLFGVSANLMSLGAIDFGIIIDGAVIIVEGILTAFHTSIFKGKISNQEKDTLILESSSKIYKSAFFGVLIILLVFIPILSLDGIEGKMFKPMAQTLIFAITGSLILSITYVPMVSSLFLSNNLEYKENFSDKLIKYLQKFYEKVLSIAFKFKLLVFGTSIFILLLSFFMFTKIGGEFLPQLEEGDLAMQMTLEPGSALSKSIKTSTLIEKILIKEFPEVKSVVSKIGTAEVPTDPMSIESADIMILLKEKSEWVSADNLKDLVEKMESKLSVLEEVQLEFSQPIQLRFNELMTGSKSDVAIQVFGNNLEKLKNLADDIVDLITGIEGANDVKAEVTEGLKIFNLKYDKQKISRFGINIKDVNQTIRTYYLGEEVGYILENDRKYNLVLRSKYKDYTEIDLNTIFVKNYNNDLIPISAFAEIKYIESPLLISREQTKRRINVGVNIRGRDTESVIKEIQDKINSKINLPEGYSIKYGGQFENLQSARNRLVIVLPIVLFMIFLLLYLAFNSIKNTLIIFTAIPFSAIGGIFSLVIRDMPFSISAGIGFIALFGISVLNGIVMIAYFEENKNEDLFKSIMNGSKSRLRPVLMTALVAAFGFIPMAISTGLGAEVQKPLATVVIGGLISSTLLTLILLPLIYYLFNKKSHKISGITLSIFMGIILVSNSVNAAETISLQKAKEIAITNSFEIKKLKLNKDYASEFKKLSNPFENLQVQTNIMDNNSETEFQAIQYFSNFLSIKKNIELSELFKDKAINFEYVKKKELIKNVEDLYAEWVFLYKKSEYIDTLLFNYQFVIKNANSKLEANEISLIDYNLIKSSQLNLISERNNNLVKLNSTKASLISILNLNQKEIKPELGMQNNFDVSKTEFDKQLLNYFESQVEIEKLNSKIQKLDKYPKFGAGVMFRQFPDGLFSSGLAVALSFPLFNNNINMISNQSAIQSEIYFNDYLQIKNEMNNELIFLLQSYKELNKMNLDYDFENSIKLLFLNLNKGNMSNLEFYQIMTSYYNAFNSQIENEFRLFLIKNKINYLTKEGK